MTDTLAWLTARPIAHRGLHDAAAGIIENTLSAVRAAIAGNFGIEVDVQLSRDGEAMVFHDGSLRRLTGQDLLLDDLTVAELQALPLIGTADHIPTLWEVLQTVDDRVPIIIEIKNDDPIRRDDHLVRRTLEVLTAYRGRVAVMSFDPRIVAIIRKRMPNLPRGIVADDTSNPVSDARLSVSERRRRRHLLHALDTRPDFVAYHVKSLPAPGPAIARALFNRPVLTWTVRTTQDRRRAATHADQIIFEGFNPDLA